MSAKHKLLPLMEGWTPRAFGSDTHLWLRSDTGVLFDADGAALTHLDQSGRGNHATQATPSRRPRYEPHGGVNGCPALVWDSSNRGMITTLSVTSNDVTVIAVLDQLAFKGVGDQHLLQQSATEFQLEQSGVQVVGIADPTNRIIGAAQLGPQILEWRLDSGALTVEGFRDGVSIGSDAYDGTNGLNGTTGVGANAATTGSFARMKLCELIIVDRLLTAAERTSFYAYAQVRYQR